MFTRGTDKFLIGIVAGVIVLVCAAFLMVLLRPAPSYRADDTPENVVHNYLLAVQQKDYARGIGYLSEDLRGRPKTAERFASDVSKYSWRFRSDNANTSWVVQKSDITGDLADVSVQETQFYGNSLFGSSQYTNTVRFQLHREDGAWKLFNADAYWMDCWDNNGGCS
jgi:hypothetical protein